MTHDPRELVRSIRPQVYGTGSPFKISDPLIEPLWTGMRVLAGIDPTGTTLLDADGVEIDGMEAIVDGLTAAAREEDDGLVLDGFITRQPGQDIKRAVWSDEMPSMGRMLGLRRNRAVDTIKLKEAALTEHAFEPDDVLTFVAIDLLWLDDTPLLDVPLLERRRLLGSVLGESAVVRLGAFIRPPIDHWVHSWRAQGFGGLTYKGANSRYLPGLPNPDWLVAGMPHR
ncbi:MAG: hypothetical protein ABI553_06665 [Chloroflexota bacterium]